MRRTTEKGGLSSVWPARWTKMREGRICGQCEFRLMTTWKSEGLHAAIESRFGVTNGLNTGEPASGLAALVVRLEKSAVGRRRTVDWVFAARGQLSDYDEVHRKAGFFSDF